MESLQMTELLFSPAVLRKLDSIHDYIYHTLQSPQAAATRIAQILKDLDILKANPDIGPRLSSRIVTIPERFSETRFLVCGNYIAVYEHKGSTVQILAIYHGHEDVFGRFLNEID